MPHDMEGGSASTLPLPAGPRSPSRPPRGRRLKSYWEPIFDPNDSAGFPDGSWDFSHSKAPHHVTYVADSLATVLSAVFTRIDFRVCDFEGVFSRRVVFRNCRFEKCDFGTSEWVDAKFTRCEFQACSFTQATFRDCEFRDCVWSQIGLSGNETRLPGTLITNPGAFIDAGYTNRDEVTLQRENKTNLEQQAKLEGTKATVARQLLANCVQIGDEQTYYDAVKTYVRQSTKAKQADLLHQLRAANVQKSVPLLIRALLCLIDMAIANATGAINGWGSSIARPFMLGVLACIVFAAVYYVFGYRESLLAALVTSVDVTLLIGYTKHAVRDGPVSEQLLFIANMLVGIVWYAVFIATIVNRVSRVR
jgi:uncharacterized protein YjbI with pentapeptide repeats